tara:strand:- start:280 stop:405 length:126 start_codon:yes stop_codon:yes gene_type:complete
MSTTIYNVELDWVMIEKIATRIVILAVAIQCDALNSVISSI